MIKLSDLELRILEKGTVGCDDVTALLGGYVDGDLTETLSIRIKEHICECPECQEGELRYREVIQLAKELPEPTLPEGVERRLRLALNAKLGINLPVE